MFNMATIISADEIKKDLPDYSPEKAESFHSESAKLADKYFYEKLKSQHFDEVILLCGGAASGKTEFLATHLINKDSCLIFDTTLSTEIGAKVKFERIAKKKKKQVIFALIPDDLKRAFIAFLHRDRKFSDNHFYRTHSGSRGTLLFIAKNYPSIKINLVESSYTKKDDKLQFKKIEFNNRELLISYLNSLQMTETAIISYIQSIL